MATHIRLEAVYYGFGPFGKVVHIAEALVGACDMDISIEIVAHPAQRALLGPDTAPLCVEEPGHRADVVISVMSRHAAERAHARGEKVLFVDSLALLWDTPLPVRHHIDAYAYQALPAFPVKEEVARAYCSAYSIGPIGLGHAGAGGGTRSSAVVVSLSGLENFESSVMEGNLWYAHYILDQIMETVGRESHLEIQLFGNADAICAINPGAARLLGRSASQQEFHRAVREAAALVVSPGLTTLIETAPTGVPLAFLPPQNYSQLKISRILQEHDVPCRNWKSDVLSWLSDARVTEVVGSQSVRNHLAYEYHSLSPMELQLGDLIHRASSWDDRKVEAIIGDGNGATDLLNIVRERYL